MQGLFLAVLCGALANAQTPPPTASASPAPGKQQTEPYQIGAGDVLDIRVFNKPQFSRESVRVTARGTIRMPLLNREIRAACRTEEELADELEQLYLEYLRTPQVDVFVKEFQSTPVAVIGAVQQPSRFQLQRRVRLLEMLSFVGGPSEKAGRTVQVIHTGPPAFCDTPAAGAEDDDKKAVDNYQLSDMLAGKDGANPVVRPGDIINIAEADQVFVVGNVLRPSALVLREPITVTRAVAMAGGLMPDTRRDKVRVIRQAPGSATKTEIFIDLKAVEKKQAEDITLQANDIVDVPTNETKRTLRTFLGSFVPSIGQLPVRVVP
jgi:polysaccharide export outer membrane protein